MNQHQPKRLGVVGLKAANNELHGRIFLKKIVSDPLLRHGVSNETYHVGKGEVGHVKDNRLSSYVS